MPAPQYTRCVQPQDYQDLDLTAEEVIAVAGLVAAIPTLGISLILSLAAVMSALRKVCDYIMGGKLVCLGGEVCAIGRVAAFETVDEKHGFLGTDKIDNDFSINLVLAPLDLSDFAHGSDSGNYQKVINEPVQGKLVSQQFGMPKPHEDKDNTYHSSDFYAPTFVPFPDSNYISYEPTDNPFQVPGSDGPPFNVFILHCEIEGERAHLVCSALSAVPDSIPGLGAVCKFKPFGIPIGRWICSIVSAALAPFVLAALGIAWFAGSDDNRNFDGAGSLKRGDCVIIRGRWVYDAGHQGWNEIHAVTFVQKLEDPEDCRPAGFQAAHEHWCGRTGEVPPITDPPLHPVGMTPGQQTVYDNQRQPENRWYLHPLVDGCEPGDAPPQGPVIN